MQSCYMCETLFLHRVCKKEQNYEIKSESQREPRNTYSISHAYSLRKLPIENVAFNDIKHALPKIITSIYSKS